MRNSLSKSHLKYCVTAIKHVHGEVNISSKCCEIIRSALGREGQFFTGKSRNSSSEMKNLLPKLSSFETCGGLVFFFPIGLLSVKLVIIQNDRIITVKTSFFK